MKTIITFLSGKKTYILAGLVAITAFSQSMGYVDSSVANLIYTILGAGSVATVRAAISKVDKNLPQ